MGFYIEELPTELNGITMQEADYLADEFLTVISEAVEVADRKTDKESK